RSVITGSPYWSIMGATPHRRAGPADTAPMPRAARAAVGEAQARGGLRWKGAQGWRACRRMLAWTIWRSIAYECTTVYHKRKNANGHMCIGGPSPAKSQPVAML